MLSRKHKYRLLWVTLLLISSGLAVFLVIQALQENINLYFTPTQILNGESPKGARIRVGGMVKKGSVKRLEGLRTQFVVTDFTQDLSIEYVGILPDLFREGQGMVALGKIDETKKVFFKADEILAKHDENYMPPLGVK